MLFVWVMGTLDFPKKVADAIERWRALPLDYRGFGDWPKEGFFSADRDTQTTTVGEALERLRTLSVGIRANLLPVGQA